MDASCPIKLDLYLPPRTHTPLPILLHLRGGGLFQGNRAGVPPHLVCDITKYNYALISADYRLAPQVGVSDILSDILDCLSFIQNDLTKDVGAGLLDTGKIALVGSSAGGYLALLAGMYAEVKPDVVMAIYPITNPLGGFFTTPQTHPMGRTERATVAPFLDKNSKFERSVDASSERNKLYYWILQVTLAELYGIPQGDKTCVVAVAARQYGKRKGLPPVYLVHADADRLVGVEQSDEVVEALGEVEGVYVYERLEGMDRLFDRDE